ncbi:MAG: response regulator [Dehalococcoidales bacterium]
MNKIGVLIADDHTIMRDGIRALLGVCDDIEVVGEASEGQEVIEKARDLAPDVILMDIAMPGMDGLEAARRILEKKPTAKVLVLTQHDNREYILSSIKAGAAGFVPKRALGSELVSAIRAVHRGEPFLHPSATAVLIETYQQQAKKETYDCLTVRQREILKLIAEGHTSREIADILSISSKTVLTHRGKMMKKLDLHSRTELIKYAMRNRLVSMDM